MRLIMDDDIVVPILVRLLIISIPLNILGAWKLIEMIIYISKTVF